MKYKYDVFISYSRRDYVDENYNVIPGTGSIKTEFTVDKSSLKLSQAQ